MDDATRDTLDYWNVPDADAPIPLARWACCDAYVCHCTSDGAGEAETDAA
jgi:hypothetical protein